MKTVSIFLALINSLVAGLLIAFSLSAAELRQAEAWWSLTKTLAAAGVILIGVLAWMSAARNVPPNLMSLGSIFLVGIGAATMVWTWHLAVVSGDPEYYMIVYGASLIAQGMASSLGLVQEGENSAAA